MKKIIHTLIFEVPQNYVRLTKCLYKMTSLLFFLFRRTIIIICYFILFLEKKEMREAKSAERPHKKHTHTSHFPDWLTELSSARKMHDDSRIVRRCWLRWEWNDDDDDCNVMLKLCWKADKKHTGHHQKKKGWLVKVDCECYSIFYYSSRRRDEKRKKVCISSASTSSSFLFFSTLTPLKNTLYTKVQWLQVELINCINNGKS